MAGLQESQKSEIRESNGATLFQSKFIRKDTVLNPPALQEQKS